jgi:hypothetical protein
MFEKQDAFFACSNRGTSPVHEHAPPVALLRREASRVTPSPVTPVGPRGVLGLADGARLPPRG